MLALSLGLAACGTLDPTDDGEPEATRTEPVEAPNDASVVVTDQEGTQLYTSDESSGAAAPEFQMTEDGFTATGTFVSDTDEEAEGSVTGAC